MSKTIVENWDTKHGDIATLLKKLQNPISVDYLFKAATSKHPYLEYDNTMQFARKCILALRAIGTEHAFNKLLHLANDSNDFVSKYAKAELAKMSN